MRMRTVAVRALLVVAVVPPVIYSATGWQEAQLRDEQQREQAAATLRYYDRVFDALTDGMDDSTVGRMLGTPSMPAQPSGWPKNVTELQQFPTDERRQFIIPEPLDLLHGSNRADHSGNSRE